MFDDKPTTSQSPVDEVIQPISTSATNPVNTGPSVVPDGFKPKKDNKEPEDIFGTSDPVTPPAAQLQTASPGIVNDSPANEAAEPTIKNAPSVFKKLASTPVTAKAISDNPAIPPMPTAVPASNKNIVIFIVLILIILGLAAAAYWFFILKEKTPPVITNNSIELFENQPLNINIEPPNEIENQNNNINSQQQDTDGDGLYDEAEILLGTSINSADTDNDGLFDKDEVKIYKTDPLKQDTDNDGWTDGEEINDYNTNPLEIDVAPELDGHYTNNQYKLSFDLLPDMVFESSNENMLQFNDNVNQIKFYIYLAGVQSASLTPDISYTINEDYAGNLIIQGSQENEDLTPYSTDLNTINYQAHNGLTYLMRYVATKRADNHLENFEQLLNSFNFKK